MNLVVDYGNTSAKVGIFDHQSLLEKLTFSTREDLAKFLAASRAENIIVSSVKADAALVSSEAVHAKRKFVLDHTLALPIKNLYATPATLGMDRLAGVCGAQQIFPEKNCL